MLSGMKVLRISQSGIATQQRLELQCKLGLVLVPLEGVGIGSELKGSAGIKKMTGTALIHFSFVVSVPLPGGWNNRSTGLEQVCRKL